MFKVCVDAFVFVLDTCKHLSRVFNKLLTYVVSRPNFVSRLSFVSR